MEIEPAHLEPVMVRRLKEDLRGLGQRFPERVVEPVVIAGLPDDAPELLARKLAEYKDLRGRRLAGESPARRAQAELIWIGLQQRLLSSIEAFARTLTVHERTLRRVLEEGAPPQRRLARIAKTLLAGVGRDDDEAELEEAALETEEELATEAATAVGAAGAGRRVWGNGGEHLSKIERVVLVHRLREVIAHVGFTRFDAAGLDETGEFDMGVELADLRPSPSGSRPSRTAGRACSSCFASRRKAWLGREPVKQRAIQLLRGFQRWDHKNPRLKRYCLSASDVMLHTVSHTLSTQLALECGYPAASLRERVYALPEQGMLGTLIHTGTSGADGTLGGLVETGHRIGDHLTAAIDAARLCSNDPVCGEHDPAAEHDPLHFYGAACHGCLLIAEPSCEQRNDWLDRALAVPTMATPDAAFFG